MSWAPRDLDNLISDPKEALDVFDFEPVAKTNLPPAHFGYMVTGIDDEVTLRANREGFLKFQLRPRRLIDVSTIDMTTEILGATYNSPIVIAPTGGNRAFHPDGEVAVAKAARTGNHLQILSSGATTSIEQATTTRGAPVWFQLYARKWEVTEALARRAERAGSPVVVVTVDGPGPTNWETLLRLQRSDTRQCNGCHGRGLQGYVARRPNYDGIDVNDPTSLNAANLTWDLIKRLRDTIKMKIVLKGIVTHEDAKLAADYGVDGIIVSNHGGRVVDDAACPCPVATWAHPPSAKTSSAASRLHRFIILLPLRADRHPRLPRTSDRLDQARVIVLDVADPRGDGPGDHFLGRIRCEQVLELIRVRRLLTEPHRPFVRVQDHRHSVVELRALLVGRRRDDRQAAHPLARW